MILTARAIGDTLPLAIAIAISAVRILTIILLLMTPAGRRNGMAFLAGWVVGLAVIATIILIVAGAAHVTASRGRSDVVSGITIVLGVALLALAARQWRMMRKAGGRREPAVDKGTPKWMSSLERFDPAKSMGLGALLGGPSPKNLILTIAAATAIAQAGLSGGQDVIAVAIFVAIASLGIIIPIVIQARNKDRDDSPLIRWRQSLVEHQAEVTLVILLVFGFVLIGKGLRGF